LKTTASAHLVNDEPYEESREFVYVFGEVNFFEYSHQSTSQNMQEPTRNISRVFKTSTRLEAPSSWCSSGNNP